MQAWHTPTGSPSPTATPIARSLGLVQEGKKSASRASRPRGCVARARARCRLVRKLNQTHVSTLGLFASLPFGLCILVYTIPTNILGVGPPGLKGPVRPLLLHPPGPGLTRTRAACISEESPWDEPAAAGPWMRRRVGDRPAVASICRRLTDARARWHRVGRGRGEVPRPRGWQRWWGCGSGLLETFFFTFAACLFGRGLS